jgi:Methylamine utilisation protein MauE
MAQALTPPMLLAVAVLCIAGAAKLRSPAAAARAFAALRLPASTALVRAVATTEIALGVWWALEPGRPAAACVAAIYAAFALAAALLARSRSDCGCFGESELPASNWQAALSAIFALVAIGALVAHAHGLGWVLDRPALEAATIVIGTAGATSATVLAYTALPAAWTSWSLQ